MDVNAFTKSTAKKVQSQFLEVKMRFVSIMVTTSFFGVLNFAFKIEGAPTAKWTFLKCPKTM